MCKMVCHVDQDHIFTEQMWEIFLWFKGIWIKIELTKKVNSCKRYCKWNLYWVDTEGTLGTTSFYLIIVT